ncbi:hypothetical protein B6N60_01909 [Richelia sinica FACHB-800]|uniref:Uncharacterized protein n=1 Tax=Richelia sinica FACHB-800 TaxID=1357546 RepID=A0A975Y4I6_9NOST|nr:hypothetical protein B6N60_01909 [Richelia sinica FACHB-800]
MSARLVSPASHSSAVDFTGYFGWGVKATRYQRPVDWK